MLAITGVETEQSYVAAGQALRGRVRLDQPPQPPKETRLRVVAVRDIDTARTDRSAAGRRTEEVLVASLAPGTSEVPFEVPTGDMLFGTIQIQAELLPAGGGGPVSAAWSRPVRVGLRKRLDLAGEWNVTGIKVFEGDVPMRPKDWKPPAPPAKLTLPGRLPFDDGFRGWVTLATAKRDRLEKPDRLAAARDLHRRRLRQRGGPRQRQARRPDMPGGRRRGADTLGRVPLSLQGPGE